MAPVTQSQKLHWFVIVTAVATLGLIGLGGLVTSHQAGMAVPDWPTTYGYNMFAFPISQWVGGIFYEHTHRLYASNIGLLTSILAAWLWWRGTKGKQRWAGLMGILALLVILTLAMIFGHRDTGYAADGTPLVPFYIKVLAAVIPVLLVYGLVQSWRHRGALHWLGLTAFFAVIFQGFLGGFRVVLYKDEIGIFHATLAQLFLLLLSVIAVMTSRWWGSVRAGLGIPSRKHLIASAATCVAIVIQLALGATMRHQHAGLAVSDFPLAHGQIWPATDDASLVDYNKARARIDYRDFKPITANQIRLHMAHRVGALIIWLGVLGLAIAYVRSLGWKSPFAKAAVVWALLLSIQAVLGALTIWTNKAADIATLHVVLGAFTLVFGSLTTLCGFRCQAVSARVHASAAAQSRTKLAATSPDVLLATR